MTRYIALLRGINISGKNKISMPELKTALGEKGFADVKSGFFFYSSQPLHRGISFGTLKGQTPPGAKPVIASTWSR